MAQYSIGIDIGTTSTKAILFDEHGRTVAREANGYPILNARPSFREMDPDVVYAAVLRTLRGLSGGADPSQIAFVSFSCMMHTLIAVDKDGAPLTNCILWADTRSAEYSKEFSKNGAGLEIYLRTGTPCHPMSPLYKLLWLKDHEPGIFGRAAKFVSIKEYVFYRLCGRYLVDYSVASATGMFNIFSLAWDAPALALLGIGEERLSRPVPPATCVAPAADAFLSAAGLSAGTQFVVGASDGCLASLGSGAVKKGCAAVTIGTSGAVRVCFDRPVTDPAGRVFCYVLAGNKYIVGGPVNNGGFAYRWFRDRFGQEEEREALQNGLSGYACLDRYIESTPAGSRGLLFLPFLMGERAPYWNADMKGAYLGITDSHRKEDFTRATVEGVCYAVNGVYQIVKALAGGIGQVYADGGFTANRECVRILCDILDTELTVFENTESACLGAMILGRHALGLTPDLDDVSWLQKSGEKFRPRAENRRLYRALFENYRLAAESLIPVFENLGNLPGAKGWSFL